MSILIVSPDLDATAALRRELERAGAESRYAQGASDASAMLASHAPHVLLVDSGVDRAASLVADLAARAPWARALVMSAAGEPRAGVDAAKVIGKPFDAGEVAEMLARELEVAHSTEQRLNAQARADALGRVVEASLEAMIGVRLDGAIDAWNAAATAIYGYDRSQMIGRPLAVLGEAPDLQRSGAREVTRRRRDGAAVRVIVSPQEVRGPGGELRGFVELSLDVTEMRRLQQELEHVERLSTLGQMAAALAHEINNGLGIIEASISFAQENPLADPELREAMADARVGVDSIQSLVRQVAGFARREPARLAAAPLDLTMRMAWRLARARALASGIQLRVEPAAGLVVVHDPVRLAQALVNLLTNAIDAARHAVSMTAHEVGGEVEILVEDDGPGVSPSIAPRLFEPFATTKPLGKGTGLGLAIVRQILIDHGGSVELSSKTSPNVGAIARVRLTAKAPSTVDEGGG